MNRIVISLVLILWSIEAFSNALDCPCRVVKVIDGDTLYIQDQAKERYKVKLKGVDAPEEQQVYGNKSKQALTRRITGHDVEVEFDRRDQHGSILGKLMLQGQDVNLAQIIEGYAWHDRRQRREQSRIDQLLYSTGETEARSKRVGLWSTPRPVAPWDFRRANSK